MKSFDSRVKRLKKIIPTCFPKLFTLIFSKISCQMKQEALGTTGSWRGEGGSEAIEDSLTMDLPEFFGSLDLSVQ